MTIVGLIGAGEMGSAVGGRLVSNGIVVRTTLAGRSAASAERVQRAGIATVDDLAGVGRESSIVLSIVPPGQALEVARAFAAAHEPRADAPVFVDCNAVSPETVHKIGEVVTAAGLRFIDAGIIGGPPSEDYTGPHIYASGDDVAPLEALRAYGLNIRTLPGAAGAASTLKMCYGGITKGFTGIGSAMVACSQKNGVYEALSAELAVSHSELYLWLTRQIATMPPKAARWVSEMEEIASFGTMEPGVAAMYRGLADRYAAIAAARANGST